MVASFFNDVNLATSRIHKAYFNQIGQKVIDFANKKIDKLLENKDAAVFLDDKKYAHIKLKAESFNSNIIISFFIDDGKINPICSCGISAKSRDAPKLWDTMIKSAQKFGQGMDIERPASPISVTFFYPEAILFRDETMLTGELVQIFATAWIGRYKKISLVN